MNIYIFFYVYDLCGVIKTVISLSANIFKRLVIGSGNGERCILNLSYVYISYILLLGNNEVDTVPTLGRRYSHECGLEIV